MLRVGFLEEFLGPLNPPMLGGQKIWYWEQLPCSSSGGMPLRSKPGHLVTLENCLLERFKEPIETHLSPLSVPCPLLLYRKRGLSLLCFSASLPLSTAALPAQLLFRLWGNNGLSVLCQLLTKDSVSSLPWELLNSQNAPACPAPFRSL